MTDTKNIYQRIQFVRNELSQMELKKSGENKHTKAKYYELGDFMPAVNKLNVEHGLTTHFNIHPSSKDKNEVASLTVYNSDKPEEMLKWVTNTAEVSVQGGQAIQNMGAKHTYMRRYLYMEAFEISEGDAVDAQAVIALEKSEIDKIMETKTIDELKKYCGDLKASYGVSHQKLILKYFNQRKEEIEDNVIKVGEEK